MFVALTITGDYWLYCEHAAYDASCNRWRRSLGVFAFAFCLHCDGCWKFEVDHGPKAVFDIAGTPRRALRLTSEAVDDWRQ